MLKNYQKFKKINNSSTRIIILLVEIFFTIPKLVDFQDTPTSPTLNGGLLSTENENGSENPTLKKKSKTSSIKPVAKTNAGPKYTKNGVMCSVAMLDGHDIEVDMPVSGNIFPS